jgi:hypothetical protein
MRQFRRLLAVSIFSLPLISVGAIPASAGNGNNEGNGNNNNGNHDNERRAAPEIDPGLLGGAVALLAGGVLILRERRRA